MTSDRLGWRGRHPWRPPGGRRQVVAAAHVHLLRRRARDRTGPRAYWTATGAPDGSGALTVRQWLRAGPEPPASAVPCG